ncbi:type II secretion system protein [Candidatus Daviesbacteria bacterium]|nr:type II secretion system protein [Candidatus Daviesbacteria bacterium]
MKKLPQSHGFTLVELLVVIAIIAVLASISLTVFGSAQKSSRDAKRRNEISSIAKSLEASRDPLTQKYTNNLTADFPSDIPSDPTSPSQYYCVRSDIAITTIPNPSSWTTSTDCPPASDGTWARIDNAHPATNDKSWNVCAKLENTADVFCVKSVGR